MSVMHYRLLICLLVLDVDWEEAARRLTSDRITRLANDHLKVAVVLRDAGDTLPHALHDYVPMHLPALICHFISVYYSIYNGFMRALSH